MIQQKRCVTNKQVDRRISAGHLYINIFTATLFIGSIVDNGFVILYTFDLPINWILWFWLNIHGIV